MAKNHLVSLEAFEPIALGVGFKILSLALLTILSSLSAFYSKEVGE